MLFLRTTFRSCFVSLLCYSCSSSAPETPITEKSADANLATTAGSVVAEEDSEKAISLPPPPKLGTPAEQRPLELSVAEAKPLLDNKDVVWIDCREQAEWDAGHIAGVQLFPMSTAADRLDELADVKDQRIIVYCRMGGRSLAVTKLLRENGFANAQSMAGGITKWAEEVDPKLAP